MAELTAAPDGIQVVTLAPRPLWRRLLDADTDALADHGPEWIDAMRDVRPLRGRQSAVRVAGRPTVRAAADLPPRHGRGGRLARLPPTGVGYRRAGRAWRGCWSRHGGAGGPAPGWCGPDVGSAESGARCILGGCCPPARHSGHATPGPCHRLDRRPRRGARPDARLHPPRPAGRGAARGAGRDGPHRATAADPPATCPSVHPPLG